MDYSPIAQSISSLAVGPSSWLIDAGLWAFAVACLAIAVGLWSSRIEARYWTAALICLVLLSLAVVVIAQVNQYAGRGNTGADVHRWATILVGVLFALATLLAFAGLATQSLTVAQFSLWLGIAWIALSMVYHWFVPADWSGMVERALGLMMIAWIAVTARRLQAMAARDQREVSRIRR